MTVRSDLETAIAQAQSQLGNYSLFARSSEDQDAKAMFSGMAHDMERHLGQLNDRLNYVMQGNP